MEQRITSSYNKIKTDHQEYVTGKNVKLHISSSISVTGGFAIQDEKWNKEGVGANVGASLQMQPEIRHPYKCLGDVEEFSIGGVLGTRYDQSMAMQQQSDISSAYITFQFLTNEGKPKISIDLGDVDNAHGRLVPNGLMLAGGSGGASGSAGSYFNSSAGANISPYAMGDDGMATKITITAYPFSNVQSLSNLQIGISYCPNSQMVGSLPLSSDTHYFNYMTLTAQPMLFATDKADANDMLSFVDENGEKVYGGPSNESDVSLFTFTKHSVTGGVSYSYVFENGLEFSLAGGGCYAKAQVGYPNDGGVANDFFIYSGNMLFGDSHIQLSLGYMDAGKSLSPKTGAFANATMGRFITGCLYINFTKATFTLSGLFNTRTFNPTTNGDKKSTAIVASAAIDVPIKSVIVFVEGNLIITSTTLENLKEEGHGGFGRKWPQNPFPQFGNNHGWVFLIGVRTFF